MRVVSDWRAVRVNRAAGQIDRDSKTGFLLAESTGLEAQHSALSNALHKH